MNPVPAPVTVHVWTVAPSRIPAFLGVLATRRRRLRNSPGLAFAKLLGTGDGRSFALRDADLRRWVGVAAWTSPAAAASADTNPVLAGLGAIARETWRLDLAVLASRGRWSGVAPFAPPGPAPGARPGSRGAGTHERPAHPDPAPIAVITRARLDPRRAARFHQARAPVVHDLYTGGRHPLVAMGIGELPIGLLGTFSVWATEADLASFAYHRAAHREVIARAATERWYAEELFARFAVVASTGTLDGADPLATPPHGPVPAPRGRSPRRPRAVSPRPR